MAGFACTWFMTVGFALSVIPGGAAELAVLDRAVPTYSDAHIRRLVPYDIDKLPRLDWDDNPWLHLAPKGTQIAMEEMFEKIRLNPKRLGKCKTFIFNFTQKHVWRLSPSYELWIISAWNDPTNKGLELTDPKWHVAGAKIVAPNDE